MRLRSHAAGIAGALLAAGTLTTGLAVEQAPAGTTGLAPAPDVGVQIQITGKAIYRNGTRPAAPSGTFPLDIGESPSYQFSAGGIDEGEGCSLGLSMSVAPTLTPPDPLPPVWWGVTARMVSKQLDGATIDVAWRRLVNTPWVQAPVNVERTRRLTLLEGEPHILDYVPVESDRGNCDALLIEAEVRFVDPPAVAGAELEYDMWLVHKGADGREDARRFVQSEAQAAPLDYAFEGVTFGADGRRQESGPVTMNVHGRVKGRARTDGRIDLVVEATQGFLTQSAGRSAGTGRKELIVSPGEVIEIALPPPGGSVGDFDLERVFAGQHSALRVAVRRVG